MLVLAYCCTRCSGWMGQVLWPSWSSHQVQSCGLWCTNHIHYFCRSANSWLICGYLFCRKKHQDDSSMNITENSRSLKCVSGWADVLPQLNCLAKCELVRAASCMRHFQVWVLDAPPFELQNQILRLLNRCLQTKLRFEPNSKQEPPSQSRLTVPVCLSVCFSGEVG